MSKRKAKESDKEQALKIKKLEEENKQLKERLAIHEKNRKICEKCNQPRKYFTCDHCNFCDRGCCICPECVECGDTTDIQSICGRCQGYVNVSCFQRHQSSGRCKDTTGKGPHD